MATEKNKLEDLTPQQWECMCERCTRCCYEKIDFHGRIYYTGTPCDQLDLQSGLCRIYGERDRLRPDCQRLTPEVVAAGILPADCPYARQIENYQGPMMGNEE